MEKINWTTTYLRSQSWLGKGRQVLEIIGQDSFHTRPTAFYSVINRFIKSFLLAFCEKARGISTTPTTEVNESVKGVQPASKERVSRAGP